MKLISVAASVILGALTLAHAQDSTDSASLAKEYEKIQQAFNSSMQEFSELYTAAKTDEERQKLFEEKYPTPSNYSPKILALAEKHPKDEATVDALIWVATQLSYTPEGGRAAELLVEHHIESEKIGHITPALAYQQSPEAKKLAAQIREKSPHRHVKASATYALGRILYTSNGDVLTPEIEKYLEEVVNEYSDIKPLSDQAKGLLFAARNIAVGKVAPEIEGEDVDGKKFKLSDYRGKVVLIDFWGDW